MTFVVGDRVVLVGRPELEVDDPEDWMDIQERSGQIAEVLNNRLFRVSWDGGPDIRESFVTPDRIRPETSPTRRSRYVELYLAQGLEPPDILDR